MQVNLKTVLFTVLTTALIGSYTSNTAFADEKGDTKEKTKELVNDGKRAAAKTSRKVKDEVCEMVDGKMKCVGKKIKHAAQNAGDNIEDAVD
jgi:hypothetical protein